MRRTACLFALCALGVPAQVQAQTDRFDGIWASGNPNACIEGLDTPNYAFRIEGGVFIGLDSRCEMGSPVEMRGLGGVHFQMRCTGEGMEWAYEQFLMIDGDGSLVAIADGSVQVFPRCTGFAEGGAPVMAPPAAPAK